LNTIASLAYIPAAIASHTALELGTVLLVDDDVIDVSGVYVPPNGTEVLPIPINIS
jgi:hypothetical protein